MVQNLLTAVGSAPYVSRPHMPHQAKGYPPGVQFRLLPFGEAALQHFVYLERPEGVELADAEGFEVVGPPLLPMRPEEVIPRGQEFATQGHLYRSVEQGFAHLAESSWARTCCSSGPAFHQADETTFGWPDLVPITDLAGANRALERIVEQGEGATGDWRDRPLRPLPRGAQRLPRDARRGSGLRTGPPRRRRRDAGGRGDRAGRLHHRPHTGGCSDLFNAIYELMLQMIARYFAFGHETPEQRQVLANVAVDLMFGSSSHSACCSPACRWARSSRMPRRAPTSSSPTGQLPAPAPPLGLAPLRGAPRRAGRLRRWPPSAGGRRCDRDGVWRA